MNIRKVFLSLFILISSFLVIDKASAVGFKLDYTHEKMQNLDEYKFVVDELVNIANQYNTKDFAFFINFGSINGYYQIQIGISGCTNDYFAWKPYYNNSSRYIYQYLNIDGNNYKLLHNSNNVSTLGAFTEHFEIYLIDVNNVAKLQAFYNNVINVFSNGSNAHNDVKSQYAISPPNGLSGAYSNLLDNSTFMVPVYSNLSVKYIQYSTSYNDTLQVNDEPYNYGDTIPTYYDYAYTPKTPTANFKSTDFHIINVNSSGKQYVIDKKIDINFSVFDTSKYTYIYSINNTIDWQYINSTRNQVYSFHVKENCFVYLKIIDNETQKDVFNTSLTIVGIGYPIPVATLVLIEDGHYENDLSKPIMYKKFNLHFDYFDTNMYDYHYVDNYLNIVSNVTKNDTTIWVWDNYSVPINVYKKGTYEKVAEYNFQITGITGSDTPIAFFDSTDVIRSCGGDDILYAKEIYISFSFVNTEEYSYQYKIVTQDENTTTNWINEDNLRYNNDFFIHLDYNATIRVQIIDKLSGKYVYTSSYNITKIEQYDDLKCILGDNYNDNLKAMQKYLIELKETSNIFNDLFHSFYDNLPNFVQLGLVFAYVILLIFITLILGGWK